MCPKQTAINSNSHRVSTTAPTKPMAATTSLASRKSVRWKVSSTGLRVSVVALILLYIAITVRISHLQRADSAYQRENSIGLSVPVKGGLQTQAAAKVASTSPGRDDCASTTLLCYYASAILMWNTAIFWRRRRRGSAVLINATLLAAFSSLQLSGECKPPMQAEEGPAITLRRDGASWFDRYAPNHMARESNVRIAFRLHDPTNVPVPDKFAGVAGYKCGDKADLPPSLSKPNVLGFTTTVATDLKIAFIGDSIAEQFAQAFDASVLGEGHEANRFARTYVNGRNGENVHNCLSVSAPIRGGGVSAYWRVATLMHQSTREDYYRCEHGWKTWTEKQALVLVNEQYRGVASSTLPGSHSQTEQSSLYTVNAYDAFVLRVPFGWITLEQITEERIVEAINLASSLLGAQTVVISTLPLNNNAITAEHWEKVAEVNQMMRDLARSWVPSGPGDVRFVLIQEFGNFTNQVLRKNSEHIRLTNTSTPDFSELGWEVSGKDFLLKRLSAEAYWAPSIAMVCAEPTFPTVNAKNQKVEDCVRSKISRDGAHWCVETIGSRYSASIACLLGCVYNGREPSIGRKEDIEMMRQCERLCNNQFQSIDPVDMGWITNEIPLVSKSF